MKYVVDTNVAVIANGKSSATTLDCISKCAAKLTKLINNDQLVIDDQWHILKEYQQHLSSSGQPGVGNAFLKWILTNYLNPKRVECITITEKKDDGVSFNEFPNDARLQNFDPDDRKFIAVANAHPERPPILQAADTKWQSFNNIFREHGIQIEFLCQ